MTYKKKLIEVALPLTAINAESSKQKTMGAAAHPQNLHRWWARRPLAATRAVLWSSLVDDPSAHPDEFPSEEEQTLERKRLFDILERLVPWSANADAAVLTEARAEIAKSCSGGLPRVLDPFAGGGAIPLEAMRLGLPTYSGDLNPVAVLIQRAMLEVPHRFAERPPAHPGARSTQGLWEGAAGLAADVASYGRWMLEEARQRIGGFYPDVALDDGKSATPIAWIWARTVRSPDPAWPAHVPLVRSFELSKKKGKPIVWVEPVIDRAAKTIRYEVRTGGTPQRGTVAAGRATCLATGSALPLAEVDAAAARGELGLDLLAVVCEANGVRSYVSATDAQRLAASSVPKLSDLEAVTEVPHGKTRGTFAGNAQGRYYGFYDFADYFHARQLLALTTLSDSAWDPRRLHTLEVRMEHDHEALFPEAVSARVA